MEQRTLLTREEVLANFARKGISISGWARQHNLPYPTVRGVLSGRCVGRFGNSHKAAVLLGIKEGEIVEDASHV